MWNLVYLIYIIFWICNSLINSLKGGGEYMNIKKFLAGSAASIMMLGITAIPAFAAG